VRIPGCRLTARERKAAADTLQRLPHVVDGETSSVAFGTLSALAAKHDLSVYDAAYLELAMRRNIPLATKDASLLAAAKKARVAIRSAP
jgi:predicted nucleic acid-binding protein